MMDRPEPQSRPDLMSEVRLRLPLPLVIPLVAVVVIAVVAVAFSRILLAVPPEAATILALATSANILVACAFVALRPRMHRVGIMEVALIALYPVLIGVVIANVGLGEETTAAEGHAAPQEEQAASGADATIVAESIQFDTDALSLPAEQDVVVTLDNQDAAPHNLSVYESEADGQAQTNPVFDGEDVAAGSSADYEFTTPAAGEYYFQCDIHPAMNGTLAVQ
jgi:plastocyanin